MIGRILLGLGLAGAAAAVLAQGGGKGEIDLATLPDVRIDKVPVNVNVNGAWPLGSRYKIGFEPSPQTLYVQFDAPDGVSSQPVDVRYVFSLDGKYDCDDGYAFCGRWPANMVSKSLRCRSLCASQLEVAA